MIILAENGARCECGSSALGPQAIEPTAICICASCGRTWRVQPVSLAPVPWHVAAGELAGSELLSQFEWLRAGVPQLLLRDAPSRGAVDWRRSLAALALSFVLALAAARVFS